MNGVLNIHYSNPIYSWRRAALMKHIPETALYHGNGDYDLAEKLLESINNSPQKNVRDSPESEYLRYLARDDYEAYFAGEISRYINNVKRRLQTQEGVNDYLRLAESRRRVFRPPPESLDPANGLAEFPMSIPYATGLKSNSIPVEMATSGELKEVVDVHNRLKNPENPQSRFSNFKGCPFAAH